MFKYELYQTLNKLEKLKLMYIKDYLIGLPYEEIKNDNVIKVIEHLQEYLKVKLNIINPNK